MKRRTAWWCSLNYLNYVRRFGRENKTKLHCTYVVEKKGGDFDTAEDARKSYHLVEQLLVKKTTKPLEYLKCCSLMRINNFASVAAMNVGETN